MRHQSIARPHDGEPCFEPPPKLSARPERRLTARIATLFAEEPHDAAHPFRDNAVTLSLGGLAVVVVAVGRAVAAAFSLPPGPLAGADDRLAGVLLTASARLRATAVPVPFEAAVAAPGAACVLLRGILLPTLSDGGAEAILSWKIVLDDDATARLRAELLGALRPAARRGAVPDVFA